MLLERIALPCFLLLIAALTLIISGFALAPIPILRVRAVASPTPFSCSPVSIGDDILFLSINSIFGSPVQDRVRVMEDGMLAPVEVVSTPAVLNYLGIVDYVPLASEETLGRGVPAPTRFREIRLIVGARGQQRIIVGEREILLYQLVPDGSALVVSVEQTPRVIACR